MHGIIYDVTKKPRLLSGEPNLGFPPVGMAITVRAEGLEEESRINYSKPSTIEHNAPVYFIGQVRKEDLRTVLKAYDACCRAEQY